MEIQTVSMREYSTLKIGGKGKVVEIKSVEELGVVVKEAKAKGLRLHVLGAGSNTYFGESLDDYLFVHNALRGLSVTGDLLYVGAGEIWDDVVSYAVKHSLYGIENLSLIPGEVGGSIVQNIGAYGVELQDVFVSCEVFDMEEMRTKTLYKHECHFGYRDSIFKREQYRYGILRATLKLSHEKKFTLTYKPLDTLSLQKNLTVSDVRKEVIRVRREKLPDVTVYPNCGSFFKNVTVSAMDFEKLQKMYPHIPTIPFNEYYKIPSAWLIEHVANMKGKKEKGVGTWEKQPLVIVKYDTATADTLDLFASTIKKAIFEKTGLFLEQEVIRIG